MKQFKRAAAAVALALAALVVMAAGANAFSMSLSPGGAITATIGSLSFGDSRGIIRVSCPATLSGSLFTGPITLGGSSSIGTLSRTTVGTCASGSGGSASGSGLPGSWDMEVNTILGTLLNAATGMLLDVPGFAIVYTVLILGMPVRCLYSGTLGILFTLNGANPYTVGTGTLLANPVPLASGSASCPASGIFRGTVVITPTQTVTFYP